MKELVFIRGEKPFTNSLVIAEGTDNQHESIIRLIRKHLDRFERWGKIKFSRVKNENPLGGRPTVIAELNEPQTMFLVSLLANTETVINFKAELVQNFLEKNTSAKSFNELIKICTLQSDSKSCIYIAELSNNALKIGRSKNPKKRLSAISNGSGLEIIRSTYIETISANAVESALKKRFADNRIKGEFFKITFEEACEELKKYADIEGA